MNIVRWSIHVSVLLMLINHFLIGFNRRPTWPSMQKSRRSTQSASSRCRSSDPATIQIDTAALTRFTVWCIDVRTISGNYWRLISGCGTVHESYCYSFFLSRAQDIEWCLLCEFLSGCRLRNEKNWKEENWTDFMDFCTCPGIAALLRRQICKLNECDDYERLESLPLWQASSEVVKNYCSIRPLIFGRPRWAIWWNASVFSDFCPLYHGTYPSPFSTISTRQPRNSTWE